jgi:PAS domain-containing protein
MASRLTVPTDLVLGLCLSPGKACAESALMMARVLPGGVFELLNAAAWARELGYLPHELTGKPLHMLMPNEPAASEELVAALLGEKDAKPLEVTLRCKDERRKSFRLHRRFDAYDHAMFVLADEVL